MESEFDSRREAAVMSDYEILKRVDSVIYDFTKRPIVKYDELKMLVDLLKVRKLYEEPNAKVRSIIGNIDDVLSSFADGVIKTDSINHQVAEDMVKLAVIREKLLGR